ncbi:MAG: sigma-70 family RNA polymerase sigma factor [Actinomycetota bacterium]|nr:sigma-70 family RNA polymerase sigma factor [Actinomycetota bacterium]
MDASVEAAVAEAHRAEWGFVLAATLRVAGDIDVAEECVQDAYAKALASWPKAGVPRSPGAWLTTVARRRALDVLRRRSANDRLAPLVAEAATTDVDEVETVVEADMVEVADDRLRLIFTCCHPSIAYEAQVALTLRLVCGLATSEVARAFLVSEPTMAARLTRAKKKIAAARIPYRVPSVDELPTRIDAVLSVVHLIFTTGHTAPAGADLVRQDLVERALELARTLASLLTDDAHVAGLLALILLTDARRAARLDERGVLVLLADQDRAAWDRAAITEGVGLVRRALACRPPGRFALMAAIAAVHAQSPSWEATDWSEIVGLYDLLVQIWPSPVVALNRAVAVGLAAGPEAGLAALDALATEPILAGYSYLAASRADFLRRLGHTAEARLAYEEAHLLSDNDVERAFLAGRLRQLGD